MFRGDGCSVKLKVSGTLQLAEQGVNVIALGSHGLKITGARGFKQQASLF